MWPHASVMIIQVASLSRTGTGSCVTDFLAGAALAAAEHRQELQQQRQRGEALQQRLDVAEGTAAAATVQQSRERARAEEQQQELQRQLLHQQQERRGLQRRLQEAQQELGRARVEAEGKAAAATALTTQLRWVALTGHTSVTEGGFTPWSYKCDRRSPCMCSQAAAAAAVG